jgi:hypothetical protein
VKTQSDLPTGSTQEPEEKKKWVEPVAALLMALATLSTAWCGYQSAAWTRQSNRLMNEFNTLERRAGLLTVQGTQQATIQTGMFMQALAAHEAGNEKLLNFYVERFSCRAAQGLRRVAGTEAFRKSKCRSASICAEPV